MDRQEGSLTLDFHHALLQDLVEDLGILKLFLNFGNHRFGQFLLLSCSYLTFVADPAIENSLGFCGERRLLLKLVCLGLELSRFLEWTY